MATAQLPLSSRLPSANSDNLPQSFNGVTRRFLFPIHKFFSKIERPLSRRVASDGNSAAVLHTKDRMSELQDESKGKSGLDEKKAQHLFQYPDGPSEATFFKYENFEELSSALAEYIVQKCNEAVKQHGKFNVVLSGGSIVKTLSLLSESPYRESVPWDKWHVFWVDERVVRLSHQDSNYKLANDIFLSKVSIPHEQIYTIQNFQDEIAAAYAYEAKLRELVKKKVIPARNNKKYPRFDFVLLGLGPDGHIASLFPNRATVAEDKRWVIPISSSPKPPPKRITMTLPCINSADHVAFVALGAQKAHVLQRVLERPALPGSLPAQMVRLTDGKLVWFADKEAATELSMENWSNAKQFPFFDFNFMKQSGAQAKA